MARYRCGNLSSLFHLIQPTIIIRLVTEEELSADEHYYFHPFCCSCGSDEKEGITIPDDLWRLSVDIYKEKPKEAASSYYDEQSLANTANATKKNCHNDVEHTQDDGNDPIPKETRRIFGMWHCENPIGLRQLLHARNIPVSITKKSKERRDNHRHETKPRWYIEVQGEPHVIQKLEADWPTISPAGRSLRLERLKQQ